MSAALVVLVPYGVLLVLLCLWGAHRGLIAWWYLRSRAPVSAPALPPTLPRVTVQLPIYNERNVVERLIEAACALEWPRDRLEIQVLDDSTDDTVELSRACADRYAAKGIDIRVLHRARREGYKAGALRDGLLQARGEFVAIFDADFVPPSDFLRRALPWFALEDPSSRVGMVQARWGHLNADTNPLTRASSLLLDGHFVLEHAGRNRSGRFFNFNGTAGVWRRSCIEDAGGWQADTVTEDLDLSYRAQLRGWRFVYLPELIVPGELPEHMTGWKNQQHRWARGSAQTARKLLPAVLHAPIPLPVKAEAVVHLTTNAAWPVVMALAVLLPPAVWVRGRADLGLLADGLLFALTTASTLGFYGLALREGYRAWAPRLAWLPLVLLLGSGMALSQTRAVLGGLFGRDLAFVRTPKRGDAPGLARLYLPAAGRGPLVELAFAAWFAAALALAVAEEWWASVPFLLQFGLGFAWVGLASLLPVSARRSAAEVVMEPAGHTAFQVTPASSVAFGRH